MTRRLLPVTLAALVMLLPAALAGAQSSTTGTIVGNVFDPTGAALAESTVKAVS